jgi:DNA-directed RNA polymerase specialized sigma24 family protein
MSKDLSKNNFLKLLDWLDPNHEKAAKKYEQIRRALIKIFISHGFSNAEDIADLTIDRVVSKIDEISASFEGEKIKYFVKVARFIQIEQSKRRDFQIDEEIIVNRQNFLTSQNDENTPWNEFTKKQIDCLEGCLNKLRAKDRQLILEYYNTGNSQTKIKEHRILAEKKTISLNALRIQIFRIKRKLLECTKKCAEKKEK